jgi:predicted ester cyclase
MTPDESAALVERFWDEVWVGRNPDAIDRFVADDFVITTAGVDVTGPQDFKAWVAAFQSTISELHWETIETFSSIDGSRVASRFQVTGRNNGMFGLPADGKPVAFTGNAILVITPDGKLARSSVERSAWELYGRLRGQS